MSIFDRAELLLQARNYSGTGSWLDESGNGHDAAFGAGAAAPTFMAHTGTTYIYFPGTTGNHLSIAGLANSTIYDYTVTYSDGTTAAGSETSSGAGALVLGADQVNFAGLKVGDVSVTADGGGAEVAGIAASTFTEPFASGVGRQGLTWTVARSASDLVTTIVDRPMFLLGGNDYFQIPDDAALDFAVGESLTVMAVIRTNSIASATETWVGKKEGINVTAGYTLHRNTANVGFLIADGAAAGGTATKGNLAAHTLATITGRRSVASDNVSAWLNGVEGTPATDGTTVTLANALSLRIGAQSKTVPTIEFAKGVITGVALWREALSGADLALAGTALANGRVDALGLHGDALFAYILENETLAVTDTELVGALNELNGTTGIEYAEARGTYLGVPPAG